MLLKPIAMMKAQAGGGVITRRKLVSGSDAANTGMRRTFSAGSFTNGDQITVTFWWKTPSGTAGNNSNTLWASQTGEYQLFSGPSTLNDTLLARMDGVNATSGVASPGAEGDWVFVYVSCGVDHSGATDVYLGLDDGTTANTATVTGGGATSDDITAAHTQYLFGDDANGAATDDGFEGEVFDFCVFDGIVAESEMQHDGSGNWQDLSTTAKNALVYRLDGQNASDPGEDSSGNGNDFTVENSGVTVSATDLPAGANT